MAEQLKNSLDNPTSTLAAGITAAALTLTVASGHGSRFPATGDFRVKLTAAADATLYELVICTSRASDVLTVTRAAEGTTARVFASADLVDLVLSAAALTAYVTENGGGAPTTADYLVGTANASLSAEIAVGTSPGGELGGTWASPTVDASHSGSTHAAVQAAAEATAASAAATHAGLASGVHGITAAAATVLDDATVAAMRATLAAAPVAATYIVQTADSELSAEQALGALATGIVKNTTTTGVLSIAVAGTDFQAADATLTALAAADWAANALPIGTGADALSQTAFAANTFPARASTGNLVAKAITDAGLALIDDANAAAQRVTLDVPSNAEAVLDTLYDANTVLAADTNDTPAALTMGASTILARLAAGNIKAASVAEIVTLLQAYTVGGTDVAVADGGTGASTAATARTNLGAAPSLLVENLQTDSYPLVLADANLCVVMNKGTANDLTVPANATQAFPIGTVIAIHQRGAGQTTVVATGGVTINSPSAKLKLTGQYSSAALRKFGTDTWVLTGDLSA